jgi:flagellar motor protein MotB
VPERNESERKANRRVEILIVEKWWNLNWS